MSHAGGPDTAHVTGWDRTAVVILGGAGCALSFSALQQMAVAIHIRPTLCWLFPLVIDGFIAYGVRALLVLRAAPLRARLYVWMLFGTATAVSVWANALHAIRLNQDTSPVTGLRLGDAVVAVLSTVAPLALAGAVHLYILIARGPDNRRPVTNADRGHPGQSHPLPAVRSDRTGQHLPQPGQVVSGHRVTEEPADRLPLSPDTQYAVSRTTTRKPGPESRARSDTGHQTGAAVRAHLVGHPDSAVTDGPRQLTPEPVTGRPDSASPITEPAVATTSVTDRRSRSAAGRQNDPDTKELLAIARTAVKAENKLTRKVVAQAIRGQKIPLSNDTLTQLMIQLRQQHGQPVTTSRD